MIIKLNKIKKKKRNYKSNLYNIKLYENYNYNINYNINIY